MTIMDFIYDRKYPVSIAADGGSIKFPPFVFVKVVEDYLKYKSQESDSLPCVTQWVAVEDQLPDTPWTTVNVLLKNGVVSSMIYSDVGETWRWYNSSSRAQFPSETNPVVKWAKLPEPPCG
jgi:hypothetical protein